MFSFFYVIQARKYVYMYAFMRVCAFTCVCVCDIFFISVNRKERLLTLYLY